MARMAGEILKSDSDTATFLGDALSNAVLHPNPLLDELNQSNRSRLRNNESMVQGALDLQMPTGLHGSDTTLQFPGA